jgi:redox-sensitive bicupin YhaK (pirin superfamily)
MKEVLGVYQAARPHWVGDGFPVRNIFSYNTFGQHISPFLLLDYAAPYQFTPGKTPRGVGQHPHRGFETVTIAYQGEVSHRDSSGGGGTIREGDVQWMTAGAGVIHEEFHSEEFTASGGTFEMVQLWVNLPAKDKMTPGRYQSLTKADIPVLNLADDAGTLRVIAGAYADTAGPAQTFSPIDIWDVKLNAGKRVTFHAAAGRHVAVVVLRGAVRVNDDHELRNASLAILDQQAGAFSIDAAEDTTLLVLSGEPLNEPIEGYGPFVMNTPLQIREAMDDFNAGRFGTIS